MKLITNLFLTILTLSIVSCAQNAENTQVTEKKETQTDEPVSVERDGLKLNYNICGEGNLTLLFVHGWCINQTYWKSQVEAFCPNYKIVTMDLAGHGESGKNRTSWAIDEYAKDVNALIAQLELKNVVLIGHSMGGNIVLEAALQNPEIVALIGVDNFKEVGVIYSEEEKAGYLGFLEAMKSNYKELVTNFASSALFHASTDSLVKERVMNDFTNADSTIATATLESLFEYGLLESEKLAEVKRPFYLIGSNATPTNVKGLEATGAQFKLVEIDSTGHYPMIEKPTEFNTLLKGVVSEIKVTE